MNEIYKGIYINLSLHKLQKVLTLITKKSLNDILNLRDKILLKMFKNKLKN